MKSTLMKKLRNELLQSKASLMWKFLKNYQLVYGDYLADSELTKQIESFINTTEKQLRKIETQIDEDMKKERQARKKAREEGEFNET